MVICVVELQAQNLGDPTGEVSLAILPHVRSSVSFSGCASQRGTIAVLSQMDGVADGLPYCRAPRPSPLPFNMSAASERPTERPSLTVTPILGRHLGNMTPPLRPAWAAPTGGLMPGPYPWARVAPADLYAVPKRGPLITLFHLSP